MTIKKELREAYKKQFRKSKSKYLNGDSLDQMFEEIVSRNIWTAEYEGDQIHWTMNRRIRNSWTLNSGAS